MAAVNGQHMQASNTKVKWAHTVALENKVNKATMEIQNMKSIMQTMDEVIQAMKSMMMSNASSGLAATGPVVIEEPQKWSQRGSLME